MTTERVQKMARINVDPGAWRILRIQALRQGATVADRPGQLVKREANRLQRGEMREVTGGGGVEASVEQESASMEVGRREYPGDAGDDRDWSAYGAERPPATRRCRRGRNDRRFHTHHRTADGRITIRCIGLHVRLADVSGALPAFV